MKLSKLFWIVLLTGALNLTGCGGSSGGGGDGGGGGGGIVFTADYSKRPIGKQSPIKIIFTQSISISGDSINPSTLLLSGGDMDSEVIETIWSDTTSANDTLTIGADRGGWSVGMNRSLTVDVTTVQGQVLNQLVLVYDVYEGTVYFVNADAADDSGNGRSAATAKQTIQAAIDKSVSDVQNPAAVVVAEGNYIVDSNAAHIVLVDGVSLYGGYNNNPGTGFTDYNRVTYVTTISDSSTATTGNVDNPNLAIEAGSGVGASTVVDGFTITGGAGDYSVAVLANGLPTIRNNIINGGSGSLQAYAIFTTSAAAIENNTINGGSGIADNLAIYSTGSSVITQNKINGGSGGTRTYGIYNDSATQFDIDRNVIGGGDGTTRSVGIQNVASSTGAITRNSVSGGTQNGTSYGLFNDGSSLITIHNNLIDGGAGNNTYGVWEENNARSIVRNNTISGGKGVGFAVGIYVSQTNQTTIENNIIFTESVAANTRCISESFGSSDPIRVDNNDLFGCTTLYLDNNITVLNLSGIHALTDTYASGNVIDDPGFCTNYFSIDCSKWRFSGTTPDSLKTGGKNGTLLGWGFSDDRSGSVRPGTGGWSMGAYKCPTPNMCPFSQG